MSNTPEQKTTGGNDGKGRWLSEIPTQDDIARLAATVFAACTARTLPPNPALKHDFSRDLSREEESVRVATRLWIYAGKYQEELRRAIEGKNPSQMWRVAGAVSEASFEDSWAQWFDPEKTAIGPLEVLAWIRKNAEAKKDREMSLAAVEAELDELGMGRFLISVENIKKLLSRRREERSAARTKRRELTQAKSRKK